MRSDEQLDILKGIFTAKTKKLYESNFMMRLAVASSSNSDWFESQLNIIDILCALFDESVMLRNPKRAVKYLCFLIKTIDELGLRVERAALDFERHELLT